MILFASSSLVNSMIIDDIALAGTFRVSHPIYLISAVGLNSLLSCRMASLISSNLSVFIVLVRVPCTRTPYIAFRTDAPFPLRSVQSSANCLRSCTSLFLVVLLLKSPLLSWCADIIFQLTIYPFQLWAMALSTWAFRLRGFIAGGLWIVVGL